MSLVRRAAVAGSFYPDEADVLRAQVAAYLADAGYAGASVHPEAAPKAMIVPHAGYIYSAPVAASAYVRLASVSARIKRVLLLGPAHTMTVRGLALPDADVFVTPLGAVPVDHAAVECINHLPYISINGAAHASEHSLEVQLPFLQILLEKFSLVPLVVGEVSPEAVAAVLESLWGGPETLILVSSDLSHYLNHDAATVLDAATSEAIAGGRYQDIGREQACGRTPIKGLLIAARTHGLEVEVVDVRNSGDIAGPRDRVVGYGAYVFYE